MIFLRAVPEELTAGVMSGAYKVTGSVVRDVASGKGVAFLQETNALQSALGGVLNVGGNMLSQGVFNPLGIVTAVQNQQIKSSLVDIQSSLGILQNLQVGTLAVSGLGLGVSVAGFALVLKRLKGIESHLSTIESKIEQVTADRRMDDLRMVFADIGTQLEKIDALPARKNRVSSAEAAEQSLATSAGRIEAIFEQRWKAMQDGDMTVADMDMLWSLAAAIRVCHEAGLRALYSIDELEAAKHLAERRAQRFFDLGKELTPDALARLCSQNAEDAAGYAEQRQRALPQAEVLVHGLRDCVASISSQSELAGHLIDNKISGPAYFAEIAKEKEQPLLALAA